MNRLEIREIEAVTRVIDITTDMFGVCTVKTSYDPEYPDEKWVVFEAEIETSKNAVALERDWIDRVLPFVPIWDFRLSIQYKS